MHQHSCYLNQQGGKYSSLSLQEGWGRIVEGKGPDWGHQLIEILTDCGLAFLELGYDWAEKIDYAFGYIEEGGDKEGAEEEVDEKCPLVEDADEDGIVSFPADLVGESDVEADDEKVAADEGEEGREAHTHCQKLAAMGPPEVDNDEGAVEHFGEDGGKDVGYYVTAIAGIIIYLH